MQTDTRPPVSVFPDYIEPISGERFVPVITYHDALPLTVAQHREWSILYTHDSLTDAYKATLTRAEIEPLVRSLQVGECHCHSGDNGVICDCQVAVPKGE